MRHLTAAEAAQLIGVGARTIHKWAREGRINRYTDGYDPAELLTAEATRDSAALMLRAGLKRADRERLLAELSDPK